MSKKTYDVLAEYTAWYKIGEVRAKDEAEALALAKEVEHPDADELGEPYDFPEIASSVREVEER